MKNFYISQADAKIMKQIYELLDSLSDNVQCKEHIATNLYQVCEVLRYTQYDEVEKRYQNALNGNKENV